MHESGQPGHGRCSDQARMRGDQLVGTAPVARQWFLLEQAGNWGPTAWAGLDLDEDAKEELEEILDDADARLMLIRRPVLDAHAQQPAPPPDGSRRWCLIETRTLGQPRVVWGRARTTAEVIAAARQFGQAGTEAAPEPASDEAAPEILLVCTHGRKDVCCAVRGRPLAARAAGLWPEATWECTHTGGDRFAGNIVLLPDGACYGGLDPDDVEGTVTAHVTGRVDTTHLRGPSGFSNHVQAAMVAAYAQFAPLAFGAVQPVSVTGGPQTWGVHLEVDGVGAVEVTGHTETSEAAYLTCKATVAQPMQVPIVDAVHADTKR